MIGIEKSEAYIRGFEDGKLAYKKELEENSDCRVRPEIINFIVDSVCDYYGVENDKLKKKSREEDVRFPRQVVMYLLANVAKVKLTAIAAMYNKHHSTVIHSKEVIQNYIDTDEFVKSEIVNLTDKAKRYIQELRNK